MDQQAWNDLLTKEKEMEQSRDDMKASIKKMEHDITNAPDELTRKKLQLSLNNLFLAQQKLELDYETLQNQKRILKLESFLDSCKQMLNEADAPKDPIADLNQKIDDMKTKIQEMQQKLVEMTNQTQLEKGLKRANMRLDMRIMRQQIKKMELDVTIFGYQKDKINNSKNMTEGCIPNLNHGIWIKNEDINGYGHRFIPIYRGVRTKHDHHLDYDVERDMVDMSDDELDELIDNNYNIYKNLSQQQKDLFIKDMNDILDDDASKDDYKMIEAISRLGIRIKSDDVDVPTTQNVDGSVGTLYDNISDYVGE